MADHGIAHFHNGPGVAEIRETDEHLLFVTHWKEVYCAPRRCFADAEAAAAFAPSAQFPFGRPGAPQQAVWAPYRVTLRVTGPTGASTEIVTVRLGRAPS